MKKSEQLKNKWNEVESILKEISKIPLKQVYYKRIYDSLNKDRKPYVVMENIGFDEDSSFRFGKTHLDIINGESEYEYISVPYEFIDDPEAYNAKIEEECIVQLIEWERKLAEEEEKAKKQKEQEEAELYKKLKEKYENGTSTNNS